MPNLLRRLRLAKKICLENCLRSIGFAVLCCVLLPAAALAAPETPAGDLPSQGEPLRVVVKNFEPFVMQREERLTGFSIDLWDEIAGRLGLPYALSEVTTVVEQLEAVQTGRADVAIAGISITSAREAEIDFSQPFFNSGLQILAPTRQQPGLLALLRVAFSPTLLQIIGLFAVVILIAAHVVWLVERRSNPHFPRDYFHGIWESIWWASVTVTTVGYGDKTPNSVVGRAMGLLWMFMGLFLIANFTANVTTALTLDELRGDIQHVDDLSGRAVATVEGSTAADYLRSWGLSPRAIETTTVQEAYALLEAGDVQAVVYDAPVLRYYVATASSSEFRVAGPIFNREDYGIALPEDSPHLEDINRAVLAIREDGTYAEVYAKWFGQALD